MSHKEWSEKRQDVRAAFSARAKVKILDDQEAACLEMDEPQGASKKAGKPVSGGGTSVSDLSNFFQQIEGTSDPRFSFIADFLFRIDEKLNRIMDVLANETGGNELQVESTLDISGSGMKMVVKGPVEKGQILSITLYLPGFSVSCLSLYGKVMHRKPVDGGTADTFLIGIQFLALNEKEREGLIAFTFYQQRKSIRQSKLEKNDRGAG